MINTFDIEGVVIDSVIDEKTKVAVLILRNDSIKRVECFVRPNMHDNINIVKGGAVLISGRFMNVDEMNVILLAEQIIVM